MHRFAASLAAVLWTVALVPSLEAGAIHQAVAAGDRAAVARLLAADPALADQPGPGTFAEPPLHLAARSGDVEMSRLLLDAGADVDGFDSDESTPLHVAAVARQAELARFLIARGADVNRRDRNGGYALSFAAAGGDTAIVRMVLEAGADLNYLSRQGANLLHLACPRGLWELAALGQRRGLDINRGDFFGITPLHRTAGADDSARVAGVLALGARPDVRDSTGATPMFVAIEREAVGAMRALLAAGADPDAANRIGMTPLHLVCYRGNLEMARLLLAAGADPSRADEEGVDPLGIAVQRRDVALALLLLERGADPARAEPYNGRTPLHMAAVCGQAEVARALLERGADRAVRDRQGATPLELAQRYGNDGVAAALGAPPSAAPGVLAGLGRLPRGEAEICYLGHSGWAVKTRDHLLVFDYFTDGALPDAPALANGYVAPAELAGERVTVFVSHAHPDHFDPAVFAWRGAIPRLTYVLGFEPDSAPPHVRVEPRQTRTVDGMRVTAIASTDQGVGFVVEVDGLVIFHAGDHANRRRDLTGDYPPEIDFLAASGLRPDIAFVPVSGCGFGDQEAVRLGVQYALDKLAPELFLPMHGGSYNCRYRDGNMAAVRVGQGTSCAAMDNRGDHLRYRKGKPS